MNNLKLDSNIYFVKDEAEWNKLRDFLVDLNYDPQFETIRGHEALVGIFGPYVRFGAFKLKVHGQGYMVFIIQERPDDA